MTVAFRIGADENGLGARLGPLVVTAVLARVDEQGQKTLKRRLPKRIRQDLDDSKRLVSHTDCRLGEAWARALFDTPPSSPSDLFARLTLEPMSKLRAPCPERVAEQCWSIRSEQFSAPEQLVARAQRHLAELRARGVAILKVRSSVVCTKLLNQARARGQNRFVADLHAMERLVLELRHALPEDVIATCGKVGGINQYGKFFGPLSGFLHAVMIEGQAESAYRFPKVGEVRFVRDADASDPLVMLASLVGKYVRELFMSRIAHHYTDAHSADSPRPSGYHDPVTSRFVDATRLFRQKSKVPDDCFERARDEVTPKTPLDMRWPMRARAES